jgi:NADPH-dependent 2,4-dienoyl-CoA reductase/sulfur reductase-like enzyme
MSRDEVSEHWDVVIVGAGPAGLAAAAVTAGAGLSTLLADENPGPGGQIYRAITSTPLRRREVLGRDYWHGEDLVRAAESSGARILQGATVWSLDCDLVVALSEGGASRLVAARRVIIATGALERPFPIPGWTLPGVMTVGAAQTLLKASGLAPAGRTVIAGCGPLLWLYAAQALRAGASIAAILDTTPRGGYLSAARHAAGFLLSPLLAKGLALMREVRGQVRIVPAVRALAAEGTSAVRAVAYEAAGGRGRLEVDTLLLHQGVVPNVNLALAAGADHRWDPRQLCFVPQLDADGATSLDGILIAGDGAGIAGAAAAEERGRLAGLAAVRALAPETPVADSQAVRQALARHERGRTFLDTLYRPADAFRRPVDEVVVCRCEEVTAGEIRATAALGCQGPNQMKAFLRCGMGPCQGRMCGLTVCELVAEAHGLSPAEVGYFRLRPPVKPVPLGEIARLPAGAAATRAVVRL